MADRAISTLTAAQTLTDSDLFVLSQSNQAKSATWRLIISYLTTALSGHGGINNIAKTSTTALADTYTITYADTTTSTFVVTNGKAISGITDYWAVSASKNVSPSTWHTTVQEMTSVNKYLWHYQSIYFNDNSTLNTDEAVVGVYGDTGDSWYVHIRYSSQEPTSDADMGTEPDNWIGIYSGISSTAPTTYTSYEWFEIKGEQGDTGNSIVSVEKTGTSGVTDTYTITYSDTSTTTFTVTNGSGIGSITKTSTSGLVDTYTVTMEDGRTSTFNVTNGNGIRSIAKSGSTGLVDTYTVTLTSGSTTTFDVTNGNGIESITQVDVTHAAGHTDEYRINFTNGDTFSFYVYNGVNGTGAVSSVDGIPSSDQDVPLLRIGSGAPTTSTVGAVKSRYFDTANSQLYICTGVDTSGQTATYTWAGASVTVDSTLSTNSTNPVQNAVLATKIGTGSLNTTATNIVGAVNELNTKIGSSTMTTTAQTVTGAVNELDADIGSATMTTTAQTLTGAVNELDADISAINSGIGDIENTIGSGSLSGFTATDLIGAANELKTALTAETTARTSADATKESKKLAFQNTVVAASAFSNTGTYASYPFRGTVALTGVTASMIPEVFFGITEATSGKFAPISTTYEGGVYIYASETPSGDITIPTIICWGAS